MDSNLVSNFPQRPIQAGASVGLQKTLEETLRGMLRWKKYLALSVIIGVTVGLAAAFLLENRRYEFHGALLYSPNEITAPYYRPPLLGNLIHAIDTPAMLEQINQRCQLGSDLSELRRNVSVELVPSGDTLVIRVIRPDKEEAERVLRTAMSTFAEESRKISKQAIGPFVKEFRANFKNAQDSYEQIDAQLQAFLEEHKLKSSESLESGLTALQGSVTELDFELEMANIELAAAQSKRDRLKSLEIPIDESLPANEQVKRTKTLANGATDSDRRQFLRDQIAKEQEDSSYAVKLSVKERELERVKKLHGQGLISDAEKERIEGELDILRAEQNVRVEQLQGKLTEVEQRLARRLVGKGGDETDELVMLAGFAEEPHLFDQSLALLELDIVGAKHKVDGLSKKLASKSQELEQLAELQKQIAPLKVSLAQAADETHRMQSLADQFNQAYKSEVDELKVVQAPTPTIDGIRSNAGKLFGAALIATVGLLIAPLFLMEWQRNNRKTPANVARAFGVPLLADLSRDKVFGEHIASAALRIQRQLPEQHATLLVIGCSGRTRLLAEALAKCGESVVVVDMDGEIPKSSERSEVRKIKYTGVDLAGDASVGASSNVDNVKLPGVGDYLQGEVAFGDLVARSTTVHNLWYLGRGAMMLPDQLMDQNRVAILLAELKKAYSIVLISGVRLGQHLRLECLVDHADRIVVCSSEAVLDQEAVEAARELIMMDGKVLGIIA